MPRLSKIGALKLIDKKAWKAEIERVMLETKGRIPEAAVILEISMRQLFRWLALKELAHVYRAGNGEHRNPKFDPEKKIDRRKTRPEMRRRGEKQVHKAHERGVVLLPSGKKLQVTEDGFKPIRRRRIVKSRWENAEK